MSGDLPSEWSAILTLTEIRTGFTGIDTTDTNLNALCPWTEPPAPEPTLDVEIASSFDEEITSPVNDEIASPVNDEIASPVNDEIASPVNDEIASPVNDEIASPVNDEIISPVNDEIISPVNDEILTLLDDELISPSDGGSISSLEPEIVLPLDEEFISPLEEVESPSALLIPSLELQVESGSTTAEEEAEFGTPPSPVETDPVEDLDTVLIPTSEELGLEVPYESEIDSSELRRIEEINGLESEIAQAKEPSFLVSISSIDGSASETLEEFFCYEDITLYGPASSNTSTSVVYITGSDFDHEQCSSRCFVDAFINTNVTILEVSLTVGEMPGDLESKFNVIVTFSEEVPLTASELSEILILVHGTVLNATQTSAQSYIVELQGFSSSTAFISILNGSYVDLAGNSGVGDSLTVFIPKVIDSKVVKTVDQVAQFGPTVLAGSITLSLLLSTLSSGSITLGIQSLGHLQLLAFIGQISVTEVSQSFSSSAGALQWSILDFTLPGRTSQLPSVVEDSIKEDVLPTSGSRRLSSTVNWLPTVVSEDWITVENGSIEDLRSSTTEATVPPSTQLEETNGYSKINVLFWKQLVLLSLVLFASLVLQAGVRIIKVWKSCKSFNNKLKQRDCFPSSLLSIFLSGVPVLLFSSTGVLSADVSSTDSKISLVVLNVAFTASIFLFYFEARRISSSSKKVMPLEKVSCEAEHLIKTKGQETVLTTNIVQPQARTLQPSEHRPDDWLPIEQELEDSLVERSSFISELVPCSPKANDGGVRRPHNRWTSIDYQRKAQNKLHSFIKSITVAPASDQDEGAGEDSSKPVSKSSAEPVNEISSSKHFAKEPEICPEEALNVSPRSQHFLERCSSPDESPIVTARGSQTKSSLEETPGSDQPTADDGLLEQPPPFSSTVNQPLQEFPGECLVLCSDVHQIFYGQN
eukprot:g4869.t1